MLPSNCKPPDIPIHGPVSFGRRGRLYLPSDMVLPAVSSGLISPAISCYKVNTIAVLDCNESKERIA